MKHFFSLFVLVAFACSLLLAGCGGSSGTPGVLNNPYAGTYDATIPLDSGKSGALALTVGTDGAATGSLTVTGPRVPSRDGFAFSLGVIQISGNVNRDGTFSFTGTDPSAGSFGISGSLPASGSGSGSVTISAGGVNYTAQIQVHQGTGGGSLQFSEVSAGINSAAFSSSPYVIISSVAGNYSIVAIPSVSDNSRSFVLNIDASVHEGDVIDLATASNVGITYRDTASNDVDWNPTGGQLRIVKLSSTSIELEFQGIVFTSDDSSGSFKVSGTLKK